MVAVYQAYQPRPVSYDVEVEAFSYILIYSLQVGFQVSFQVEQERVTWKVTCRHLLLALGRKFFFGEIILDNLSFM